MASFGDKLPNLIIRNAKTSVGYERGVAIAQTFIQEHPRLECGNGIYHSSIYGYDKYPHLQGTLDISAIAYWTRTGSVIVRFLK